MTVEEGYKFSLKTVLVSFAPTEPNPGFTFFSFLKGIKVAVRTRAQDPWIRVFTPTVQK